MITLYETDTHKIETGGRLQNDSEKERAWRDSELLRTDSMLQDDRPDIEAIKTYRQLLRDYPDSKEFPEGTRPKQ